MLEPSIGSGAFLLPVVERLLVSAQFHHVQPELLHDCLFGVELQAVHVRSCYLKVKTLLLSHGLDEEVSESLAAHWLKVGDFLLDEVPGDADFVIGNPPYIRTEDLDDDVEKAYRQRWKTMRG